MTVLSNNINFRGMSFPLVRRELDRRMKTLAHEDPQVFWQGRDVSEDPSARMSELMNVSYTMDLSLFGDGLDYYQDAISPNLPWADDHFAERVCGYPINPGVQWRHWPWGESAESFLDGGIFNHNYMERFWPKWVGLGDDQPTRTPREYREACIGVNNYETWQTLTRDEDSALAGIRNPYGDLDDWLNHLAADPGTRQAWYPIFFPEDVGQVVGGRKPCSLGYQVMIRDGRLHMYYPLRSCDLARHYNDDVYLAIRMMLWVIEGLGKRGVPDIRLGSFSFHATSLHCSVNEVRTLGQ